jgi:zinc transporter
MRGEREDERKETVWLHLNREDPAVAEWLKQESEIDPVICEALLAEETRPRVARSGEGLLVILRGVNLNPGAEPDDMVSIRIWVESRRIVSLWLRNLKAIEDVKTELAEGTGATTAGGLLVELAERLSERMSSVLTDLNETVDVLEEEVITEESQSLRPKLARLRREAIALRRYLAPQRDVLARLQTERLDLLSDIDRVRLREAADRITRYVEDLDAVRDRAAVTQDELNNRIAERMNKTMYVLSIVAAIFLPLGLLTGLLGINVGGIPGAESPAGFAAVTVMLFAIAGGLVWLFKWVGWI